MFPFFSLSVLVLWNKSNKKKSIEQQNELVPNKASLLYIGIFWVSWGIHFHLRSTATHPLVYLSWFSCHLPVWISGWAVSLSDMSPFEKQEVDLSCRGTWNGSDGQEVGPFAESLILVLLQTSILPPSWQRWKEICSETKQQLKWLTLKIHYSAGCFPCFTPDFSSVTETLFYCSTREATLGILYKTKHFSLAGFALWLVSQWCLIECRGLLSVNLILFILPSGRICGRL